VDIYNAELPADEIITPELARRLRAAFPVEETLRTLGLATSER